MSKAIIILGAWVGPDGPSPSLQRRTRHAAALYAQGVAPLLVPCGGLGRFPPTEAEAMRDILLQAGVPDDAIHLDPASTSTYENLINAKAILKPFRVANVIIVTDSLHAPRAVMTARALGFVAKASCPALKDMPIKTRLRRFRHEALAFPLYLLRLPIWAWRHRSR